MCHFYRRSLPVTPIRHGKLLCGTLIACCYMECRETGNNALMEIMLSEAENPKSGRAIDFMRRWSHFLEKAFRVPGTQMRFGWDPILGLIPGLGDIVTGLFSLFLLIHAFRLRVPGIIRARMVVNTLIDVVSGCIPFVGDIFDFAWKSNSRNLALLEKHAGTAADARASDWLFVIAILAAALAIVLAPLLILAAFLRKFEMLFLGAPLFGNISLL